MEDNEDSEAPRKLKGTFTCYKCGQKYDNKFKRRRRVITGWSAGRSVRAYYRTVNLCPDCYQQQVQYDQLVALTFIPVIAILLIVIGILIVFHQS